MPWKCPSCGTQNHETFDNCTCGYSSKGDVLIKQELNDQQVFGGGAQVFESPLDCPSDQDTWLRMPREDHHTQAPVSSDSRSSMPDEEVIKEVDSWLFTFSRTDGCISIGTPALRSFRLKISLEDLEDLLEFLYQKTGNEKTTRKLNLSVTDVVGLIDKVDRLMEEKKSKISIKFSSDELQEVADFVNLQLKI